jgi:LmbE family N-acetylglucosaminyl deacetylase
MKPTTDRGPLLAFGAHPDDIEFGCGGVVAQETQSGRAARFVICSRGEAGTHGTPRQRTAEARKAAAILGASLEFLDFGGDAHFEVRVAHVLKLAAIMRRIRPAIVLAPTPVANQHPDHAALGTMVRNAARLARYGGVRELKRATPHAIDALLFYAIAVEGEPAGEKPVFVDVSSPPVLQAWRASMLAHATQAQTRRYTELQLARAEVHGARCGVAAAMALFPSDPIVVARLDALGRTARRF